MVRLLEEILKGRDPRDAWAFVGRVCGVCTSIHSLTSVRSVEDALGINIPPNAELVRNIMFCAQYMHDHVVHFYHLHAMDWVDVVNALKADPKRTSELAQSISKWPKSSPGYFSDIQTRVQKFVESGQLGIFANGYWGHPAYKLPAEVNLIGLAHYLEALEWQKEIVKIHAIFGGKNPHPNYLVGGMACAINMDDVSGINAERLAYVGQLLKDGKEFIEQVYIPDLMAIASFYKDWAAIGGGLGNYLVYGDLPTKGFNDPSSYKFPGGAILNKDVSKVYDVDLRKDGEVEEYIAHSWYDYKEGKDKGLHPWKGESKVNYTGPKPPFENLDTTKPYSYLKHPGGKAMPWKLVHYRVCL
jgi:hydrogenase large subunit